MPKKKNHADELWYELGSKEADVMYGQSTWINIMSGLGGDDTIYDYDINSDEKHPEKLFASDAFMFGNSGNDSITSFGGNDVLQGGKGDDFMTVYLMDDEKHITGDTRTEVHGGKGDDTLELHGFTSNVKMLVNEETGSTLVWEDHKTVEVYATVENWTFV